MNTDLAARVHDSAPRTRILIVIVMIVMVFLVSWQSAEFRPSGDVVAFWWPAAAIGAATLIMVRRDRRLAAAGGVFAAVFWGNMIVDRPLDLVLGYAVANTAAAWVVAHIATRGGSYATIRSVRSASRFLIAATAGAAVVATLGAASAALFADADVGLTFVALFPSHASALLVLTPLVLVEWRWRALGSAREATLQVIVFVTILVVAYWPDNAVPVGFVTIAVLLWAGFRLPMPLLAVQLAVLGVVATTVTAFGFGSYADIVPGDPRLDIVIVQAYLIVHACAGLLVSATRAEWGEVTAALAARESLLRGGLLGLETGIVIGEYNGGRTVRILQMNAPAYRALGLTMPEHSAAERMIRIDGSAPIFGVPELDALIRDARSGSFELVATAGRYDIDVTTHKGPTGSTLLTIVFTDVTARDERERTALATAEQLRDLNRQKDAFIASVSHELRTPVTAILGFAEELADAALPAAEQQAAMIIDRNARRLAAVIDDVLELSRLTSAAPSARPAAEVNVTALVCMACDDAIGLASGKRLTITKDFTERAMVVPTIEPDLERVIANLLSNAVKFSPLDGTVIVSLVETSSELVVRITDEGPGIPTDQLERVWERFYRVQNESHRDVPGTGLGLPIVRSLVELRLGGQVRLISDGRSGTIAELRIPRDGPAVPPTTGVISAVDAGL